VPVELYLFDCMFYEGIDLTNLPLVDRKWCSGTSW
jgi:ATP-dependent DNA ligase